MKTALTIGHNDLKLFFRHRSSIVWLFVIPLAMTYLLGFAVRGPGSPSNHRPSIRMENADTGFMGRLLVAELGSQGLRILSPTNASQPVATVRIPAGMTAGVLEGKTASAELIPAKDANADSAMQVKLRLTRAVVALNTYLVEYALKYGTNTPFGEEKLAALQKRENPVQLNATFAGNKPQPVGFNFSLPGNMVMYLLMNLLIFGGTSLASERQGGQLRRMATSPITRMTLILGKLYGLMLLAAVQVLVYLLAGHFIFHVDFGPHLVSILFMLLVYAWVAASMGMLVGSLVKTEDKVVGLCVLTSLLMAALGGCWWPMEILPDTMRVVAHCVPTGWAMDALHQMITFGGGLAAASTALWALAGYGVVFTAGAIRFFRI